MKPEKLALLIGGRRSDTVQTVLFVEWLFGKLSNSTDNRIIKNYVCSVEIGCSYNLLMGFNIAKFMELQCRSN